MNDTPKTLIAALVAVVLSGSAAAQVYQSKDAEGNPVFTDTPSPGAEAVDLSEANIADSVEVRPPEEHVASPKPKREKPDGADGSGDDGAGDSADDNDRDNIIYVGGADDRPVGIPGRPAEGRPVVTPHPVARPRVGGGRR